jgi:hypothetical protein
MAKPSMAGGTGKVKTPQHWIAANPGEQQYHFEPPCMANSLGQRLLKNINDY